MGYNGLMKIRHETYTLKNGMQILLVNTRSSYSVDISASSHYGASLETPKNQGITHFIEHMALTATEKYPTKKAFNRAMEANGGNSNAATSNEFVTFNMNLPYKKLEFGLEMMNQVLYKSTFDKHYLEKERAIILDEISKYEDDTDYRASKYLYDVLLTKQCGYSLDIIGTKNIVKNLSRAKLLAHYKKVNAPENILLTIAGNFDMQKAKTLIHKYFADIQGSKRNISYPDVDVKRGVVSSKNDKKSDLIMHSTIFEGKEGKSLSTYETILIFLIRTILTGPTTSRLNKRLREEEGLLYHIGSSYSIFEKFSMLEIYFEISPSHYPKAFSILMEELKDFYENGITEEELKHYKDYLINRNLIEFDNFHKNAVRIRNSIFYNKEVYSVEEMNRSIKKLGVKEVNAFIKTVFKLKNANHIAYGNTDSKTAKTMNKIIRSMPSA